MNIVSARFAELQRLVKQGMEKKEPRTEAQEDQMALEDMILLKEGAFSLARYRRKWKRQRSLHLDELPSHERAIIERERADQKDFPAPPKSDEYVSRPEWTENNGPSSNDVPIAWMSKEDDAE